MSILTPTKVAPPELPPPRSRRRFRRAVVSVASLGAALAVGLVVWLGVPGPDGGTAEAELTRGQVADAARLEGRAALYEQLSRERGLEADAARWAAQAEFYERIREARADAAAAARLQGQADQHAER
jgi:hypothetical protein